MPIPFDTKSGPFIPNAGKTVSWPPARGGPAPPVTTPGPRDGFIVAFGPIDGITSHKALPETLLFQCPPLDTFPADFTWQWNDYGTINGGMHSNPQYPELTTIQFDSMFVLEDGANKDVVVSTTKQSMFNRARVLKALGDSMTPFAVQVGSAKAIGEWEPLGRRAQAQMAATLRAFHWETRAGEPDTRYFTVQLTEFADAGLLKKIVPPRIADISRSPKGATTSSKGMRIIRIFDPNELTPNVRTLAQMAIWAYGRVDGWRLIVKASPGLVGVGPNDDLRAALGKRKPAVKIIVPYRTDVHPADKAKTR